MPWNSYTWSAIGVPSLYLKRINFLIKNILLVPSLRAYNSSNFYHKVHACVSSMIWFRTLSSTRYRMNPQACRWSISHWPSFICSFVFSQAVGDLADGLAVVWNYYKDNGTRFPLLPVGATQQIVAAISQVRKPVLSMPCFQYSWRL